MSPGTSLPTAARLGRTFRVHLARSNKSLDIPEHRSILDVVLDAQVHIRHACHSGRCGACEVTVLTGVPEHRDPVYANTSRPPADRMKLCVSRSVTDELTLDL